MPVHDWSKVDAGTFHDFLQGWIIEIRNTLNRGLLPEGAYAKVERIATDAGNVSSQSEEEIYAAIADRIVLREAKGDRILSIVDIVSPGSKSSELGMSQLVTRLSGEFKNGYHLLIVDLHRTCTPDPRGLHERIWENLVGKPHVVDTSGKEPFGVLCYRAGSTPKGHFYGVALHTTLPDVPLYLTAEPPLLTTQNCINILFTSQYVALPLEATYMAAWNDLPHRWRDVIESE